MLGWHRTTYTKPGFCMLPRRQQMSFVKSGCDGKAGYTHGFKKRVQSLSSARLRGKANHQSTEVLRKPVCFQGVSSTDVCADELDGGTMRSARKDTGFFVVATASLQHDASSGDRVTGITACRFLEHYGDALRHRTVRTQDICKRNGAVVRIPVDDPLIKTRLASEGRIEAGCVDAQRVGHVRHTDSFISPGMEQVLSSRDGLINIEFARATSRSNSFFSHDYKIILTPSSVRLL